VTVNASEEPAKFGATQIIIICVVVGGVAIAVAVILLLRYRSRQKMRVAMAKAEEYNKPKHSHNHSNVPTDNMSDVSALEASHANFNKSNKVVPKNDVGHYTTTERPF
jgi:flagellar basal body-associated protein FliL